jgi:hypothetical protein
MGYRTLWPRPGGTPLDLPLSEGLGGTANSPAGGVAYFHDRSIRLADQELQGWDYSFLALTETGSLTVG